MKPMGMEWVGVGGRSDDFMGRRVHLKMYR